MSTDSRLPDPETTEAESITVATDDVLEQIEDENPFKETIADLRAAGDSWRSIWERLEDAYNPVDNASYEESFVEIPEYEIRAVVPDEQSTSGERYETFTHADETEDAAREWVRSKPEVRRIEAVEQIGEVKVG
ncbi:hypothetical protein [Natronorubrum texcoconense]|uniref:Uncharacterized protein n=1 Tax=Natronorubrum texcoconense TaxID=1095776 RepID=A0A1G9HAD1_9EURY|nr:hypothetical protein [Natronorubrum texcoconense]SDL09886.1 hypothetical protein SAMN04515672_0170 [Natronorubrum texcoconense]